MSGRYCAKHEEWAPIGECRWCEPTQKKESAPLTYMGIPVIVDPSMRASDPPILVSWPSGAKLQQMMNDLWAKMVREDQLRALESDRVSPDNAIVRLLKRDKKP